MFRTWYCLWRLFTSWRSTKGQFPTFFVEFLSGFTLLSHSPKFRFQFPVQTRSWVFCLFVLMQVCKAFSGRSKKPSQESCRSRRSRSAVGLRVSESTCSVDAPFAEGKRERSLIPHGNETNGKSEWIDNHMVLQVIQLTNDWFLYR